MLNIFNHQNLEYSHDKYTAYVPTSFNVSVTNEVIENEPYRTEKVYRLDVKLQANVTYGFMDTKDEVIRKAQQHIVRQLYRDSHAIISDIMYEIDSGNIQTVRESVQHLMKIVGMKP